MPETTLDLGYTEFPGDEGNKKALDNARYIKNDYIEFIKIDSYKLKDKLRNFVDRIEKKNSWPTPFAFTMSLFITLITSNFKDSFGFKAAFLEKIYYIIIILSIIWLLWSVLKSIECWKKCDIEEIMNDIKYNP